MESDNPIIAQTYPAFEFLNEASYIGGFVK